ncbi:protein ENTREP3 isoform X4 [Hyperolius riggenbachi]|uniref:protein ENTREP3 isoform X4 n=1 Tax=Hyperolius riggenbachi TaxID=752182 RepID=UPI0035A2BE90
MPSPSDSSFSLTGRTSRSLSQLRLHRAWTHILLALGFMQVILGVLIVTFSLVTASITPNMKIKHSCPSWAGFSLAVSGLISCISWKKPFTLVVTALTLLSALSVMLNLAGSILSCQNGQLVKSFNSCKKENNWCICCHPALQPEVPSSCGELEKLVLYPNHQCDSIRSALKDLLFSVCGLTILSTIICTMSAVICCVQIFSLDVIHVLAPHRSTSVNLECFSPPDTMLQSMIECEEFVPPVPPPPYYPPEYTCSSETDAQSITYNGSMDSPIPLYPTDFPPSYESVMGIREDSQATLYDVQANENSTHSVSDRIGSTGHSANDFGDVDYRKGLEEDDAALLSADAAAVCAEAGPHRRRPPISPLLLRTGSLGKNPVLLTHRTLQRLSRSGALSLGDLKGGRNTRLFVARFLNCSRRSLKEGSSNGKQPLKSPFPLDSERRQSGISMQSCGDLSSTSSLRRLLSTSRRGNQRPHSLNDSRKESAV